MKNDSVAEINQSLLEADKFLLTSHVSPDGDNIGSVLAAKFMLDQLGKESTIILPDAVPDCFSFLPGAEEIVEYTPELEIETDWETVLVLDCGDRERMGSVNDLVEDKLIVNLDHHPDNTYFGDYNLVKEAAATAELVYKLIMDAEGVKLNDDLSWVLATGLITDTGSFKYDNTTSKTHRIMADLLAYDVKPDYINRQIFGTNSYEALLLRGAVLDTLQISPSGQVAWVLVDQEMLSKVGATMEDTEGLVGYPRSLKGVEVGVLFKEKAPGEIKVSLRSNEFFPVNEIAHQFGGGGHPRAAGCLIEEKLSTAQQQVIEAVEKELTAD